MIKNKDWIESFEKNVKRYFPFLKKRYIKTINGEKLEYKLTLEVRCYEKRKVKIIIDSSDNGVYSKVTCDGPKSSKHRYSDGSLCIWYPKDELNKRWMTIDGLLCLIRMVEAHLFREAYWRETGMWLGPEFDHSNEIKDKISGPNS